ncbi:hypothetical protein DM02DRAFT_708060 [Periconia macrospinosa]|uniref:Fungal calcium binding protein domain-containing protein n=1 Tax=Periconia macrospinosa TaxID=97972 RepID=A0A2V1DRQ3_9PLEO|nr:hypothetical protein DM02DRAFT_708060 [Periconia macrospinosa]
MRAATIILAFATCAISTAIPQLSSPSLGRRQDNLAAVEAILEDARFQRAESFRQSDGSRRQLAECSANCKSCLVGATTKAVFEIAGCGVAAAAVDIGTGNVAAVLAATGFVACEGAVVGAFQESQANCDSLT